MPGTAAAVIGGQGRILRSQASTRAYDEIGVADVAERGIDVLFALVRAMSV